MPGMPMALTDNEEWYTRAAQTCIEPDKAESPFTRSRPGKADACPAPGEETLTPIAPWVILYSDIRET